MPSARRRLVVVIVIALTAALLRGNVSAQGSDAASGITLKARSFQPGELIVATIAGGAKADRVTISLCGREATAYELQPGRWQALVGIDLEQKPGTYVAVVAEHRGNAVVRRERQVIVRAKQFPTRVLSVPPEFVNPPPEAQQQIASDSAFLRELYANSATERLWRGAIVRPVPDPANSRFGTRSVFNGEKRNPHAGADFSSPPGRPIAAPAAAHVVAARALYFTGNTVVLDHGLGMFSILAHMSQIDVKEGDSVAAGQIVGLVGATGRVTGAHLHWTLLVNGARVDPVSLLTLLGEPAPSSKKRAR